MNPSRIAGLAFSILATVIAVASVLLPPINATTELVIAAFLIALFGMPHGALDTVYAQEVYQLRTVAGWIGFTLLYLLPILLVVLVWQFAPTLFLWGFLIISLAHFSADPSSGTPLMARIFYGGAIIVLPALLHASEVARLFSMLIGVERAAAVVLWLNVLSWPWLAGIVAFAAYCLWLEWLTGVEIAAVAVLAVLGSPLLAFTVFFCGMHSLRHILRTASYAAGATSLLFAAAILPLLAWLGLFVSALFFWRDIPLEARLMQLIFVGLAALTVPHMALLERVRQSGWRKHSGHIKDFV